MSFVLGADRLLIGAMAMSEIDEKIKRHLTEDELLKHLT